MKLVQHQRSIITFINLIFNLDKYQSLEIIFVRYGFIFVVHLLTEIHDMPKVLGHLLDFKESPKN